MRHRWSSSSIFLALAAAACVEPSAEAPLAPLGGADSSPNANGSLDVAALLDAPSVGAEAVQRLHLGEGGWFANQPLMGFALRLDGSGARFSADGGEVGLSLQGWGRDGSITAVAAAPPEAAACTPMAADPDGECAPRVAYAYDGLAEWWVSAPGVVQVGWELEDRPAGEGPVVLALTLDGATARGEDATSVWFDTFERSYWFGDLRAEDADGAPLRAWMEPTEAGLRIVVDDEGARWPLFVDPTTLSAAWTATGATSSWFGWSVGGGGDVNGDGYADIIVGAPYYVSNTGRAYVYLGSSSGPATSASTTITAPSSSYWLGTGVAIVSDTNGDGYDDVIVGSDHYNYGQGAIFVHRGSSSGVSSTATQSILSSTSTGLGCAVASAGDVNGDGYGDVIAGAYTATGRAGAAYVYHGSSSGLTLATTLNGSTAYAEFGTSVSGAGDVNNDGYDDVVVGAPRYDSYLGYVQVFHGSSTGISSVAARTLAATTAGEYFGQSVAGAGDVNGDGYADVIVGAPYAASNNGRAAIYHGSASGIPATASTAISGVSTGHLGWSVAGVGDYNDDGYADVGVGAYTYGAYGFMGVYAGASTGVSTSYTASAGGPWGSNLGSAVAFAGDVNGDGPTDIVVGGYGYSSSAGYAAVYYGSTDADGDGYESGTGTTADCDDTDATIHPGATETVGDGVDYNCDGAETCYDDDDNDGYLDTAADTRASTDTDCDDAYEGYGIDPTTDCDDTLSTRSPGNTEIVGDGVDGDCDSRETCYDDDDNDGYLDTSADTRASTDTDCTDSYEGTSADLTTDCDDTTSSIKPGATETVGDGVDYNCDGAETCYDDDDNDGVLDATGDTRASTDTDCDDASEGKSTDLTTDCSDSNAARFPGNTETVGDGVDGDCDNRETCYDDDDNDGYLDATGDTRASSDSDCSDAYEGTSSDAITDCDDSSSTVKPGATDAVGDGVDSDCDGIETCYDDDDDDGYLDTTGDTRASADSDCSDTNEGLSSDPVTDCDDADASINPGVSEIVGDEVDQTCDGKELCYDDDDDDGYLDSAGDTRTSSDADCADSHEAAATAPTGDCDDTLAAAYPGATEIVGDSVDEDCDGAELCYDDDDADGYLDTVGDTRASLDSDCADAGEGSTTTPTSDCDDSDAGLSPSATEIVGDEVDEDCDGTERCYDDDDDDGYLDTRGDVRTSTDDDCGDANEGRSGDPTSDCDDTVAAVYPGATETPIDGVDQDCDGGDTCYTDADGDHWGSTLHLASADLDCADAGETEDATDCDDGASSVYPGAAEVTADGVDQDCDGGDVCSVDADGDGYGSTLTVSSADLDCADSGESGNATDCDDAAGATFPGATEVVADAIDEDCDGVESCYADVDADGFGSADTVFGAGLACDALGESTTADDCGPTDPASWPGATEVVADGTDQDCDGAELCYVDADGDGQGSTDTFASANLGCDGPGESTVATDCDDGDPAAWLGAPEVTADGLDQDCDGTDTCYVDADHDGYGDPEAAAVIGALGCAEPGLSLSSLDCDDTDTTVNPDGVELAVDGVDQDCDGLETCWEDGDGDGHGVSVAVSSGALDCVGAGVAAVDDDCVDTAAAIAPGVAELCNGVDDDCDGTVDDGIDDCVDGQRTRGLCGCDGVGGVMSLVGPVAALALTLRRRRPTPNGTPARRGAAPGTRS